MPDIDVRQLMTAPVLTVEPEESVEAVADAMLDQGIRSIVAVDEDCQPVGILTSTDFVKIVAQVTPKDTTTVGDHMTTDIVTTSPDRPIPEVASEMVERGVSHFPVIDDDGEVIGIITANDLTDFIAGMAVREPSE
jgi:CBS domain-containing protein